MDYDYAGIRKARRAVGVTQEELARQLGINRATVSKYESGSIDLSLGQLQKIAKILHTTVYEMVNPDWEAIDTSDSFASDQEIKEKFKQDSVEDADYQKRLDAAYKRLNVEGQRVATAAVEIIAEVPRYRAEARQEAGESVPAPSEGKDTTPTETPAEEPEKGG